MNEALLNKMGTIDSKTSQTVMNPLGRCCHDCSRYCLDECACEYGCGCCHIKIQTHHTPSAQAGGDEEDFESINDVDAT